MGNIKETLDRARSEAQNLHKNIDATAAKDHAAMRADIKDSAEKAKRLSGKIYRRPKGTVLNDSFTDDDYADYLNPYDYVPYFSN
jgi:hypothetical protein